MHRSSTWHFLIELLNLFTFSLYFFPFSFKLFRLQVINTSAQDAVYSPTFLFRARQ